jgi:hypothetical protein
MSENMPHNTETIIIVFITLPPIVKLHQLAFACGLVSWLMYLIPAIQEAEIGRVEGQGQLEQNFSETPSQQIK